jgi:hypothetical protein
MITFTLRVVMPTAKRRDLIKSVGVLLASTRVQPGCIAAVREVRSRRHH